jgi:hypothetical protein
MICKLNFSQKKDALGLADDGLVGLEVSLVAGMRGR